MALFTQATSVATGTGVVQPESVTYVGQKFAVNDGREVSLVSNGAVALVSGVVVQGQAITANHQNLTVAVPTTAPATVGTFVVSVTLGATKLNTQQYQGGYAIVNAGTGIGQTLRIASNSNAAASAAGTLITVEDPIQVTLDATSRVCLIPSPYSFVVVNPTTATNTVAGVTLYPVAASTLPTFDGTTGKITAAGTLQYAFITTKGVTSVLSDVTAPGVGQGVAPSTTTAGSIASQSTFATSIGRTVQAAVSAEARTVFVDF